MRNSVKFTETQTFKESVGTRYSARPESYFEGEPYGVVTLTCGCFHAYTHQVEDPAEMLWSTPRDNAMAEAVGGLPIMDVPYQVGNPDSYPPAPNDSMGARSRPLTSCSPSRRASSSATRADRDSG